MGLAEAVKQKALELGFDLVGIARAGPAPGHPRLGAWLAAGMHGEMQYMARTADARRHPEHVLADCRSLVMVAMSYRSGQPKRVAACTGDRVWVSPYAWGRDYHKVMKKRLIGLGHRLEELRPGVAWRAVVDTAPLLEREWAATAGLGWIGKSTQLINRRLGSELFLGALLTDVALAPDRPARAHCGRCTACRDACPTGALLAGGGLDARRCVAYLTIEHRGSVAAELQPSIGRMIAGCDICQEACPWNRRAPVDLHPELLPRVERQAPELRSLEAMDEEAFLAWRAGSPLTRVRYDQFRRNLAIARENLSR